MNFVNNKKALAGLSLGLLVLAMGILRGPSVLDGYAAITGLWNRGPIPRPSASSVTASASEIGEPGTYNETMRFACTDAEQATRAKVDPALGEVKCAKNYAPSATLFKKYKKQENCESLKMGGDPKLICTCEYEIVWSNACRPRG